MNNMRFEKRTDAARKCISPVIHQLDQMGTAAYGGCYYDEKDQNVLHINITDDIRTNLRTDYLTGESLPEFDKHIKFHRVKYSEAQIRELQRVVHTEVMGKFGVHMSFYNVQDNKLVLSVDEDAPEVRTEVLLALGKVGINANDMIEFRKEERMHAIGEGLDFTGHPVDMSKGIPDRVMDQAAAANISVAPGSWIGCGATQYGILSVSSICTGFLYGGQPGFLTCGHGNAVGWNAYYWPAPAGGYPHLNPDRSTIIHIGQTAAVRWQTNDPYDYCSIMRTNSSAIMNPANYCGGTIDGDTGTPKANDAMAVCGCANGAIFSTCADASCEALVEEEGVLYNKTDMIRMNASVNSGTSGGSVAYLNAQNRVNLTASVTGGNGFSSVHAKYSHVKNAFNLTTIY